MLECYDVILSCRDKRTRSFAEGKRVKAFGGIARNAEMRLDQLEAATSLLDLDLPGNRLEALKGDRKGSTASVSMISGGSVLSGRKVERVRATSRSSTITRRRPWRAQQFIRESILPSSLKRST